MKIAKQSNFVGFKNVNPETYIKTLDKDLLNIFTWLNRFPKTYIQAAEPSIPSDEMAFWKDSDNDKFYLLKNIDGTQKKVELT